LMGVVAAVAAAVGRCTVYRCSRGIPEGMCPLFVQVQPAHYGGGGLWSMAAGDRCRTCLLEAPPPIRLGCACRGHAGLAHVACLAKAAETDKRGKVAYHTCELCETRFTGSMRMGMAQAWIGLAEGLQKDEPMRLCAENNYAAALCAHGEVGVAEAICRAVLQEQQRVCGEDHPDTITTAENLASCLYRQGKDEEAEAVFRAVLASLKRVHGETHPDTLNTVGTLALCLFGKEGRLGEAQAMYDEFLTAVQALRGDEHPDTMPTLTTFTLTLLHQRHFALAEPLQRALLEMHRRVSGLEHKDTLKTTVDLAVGLSEQGKYAEAEAIFAELLPKMKRTYGDADPSTINVERGLMLAMLCQGKQVQ
jgi:hypothetical protein